LPKFIVLTVLLAAGTAVADPTAADPTAEKALLRLTATNARLATRLRAADELAELRATVLLLDAWVAGGEHIEAIAPTCFHRIGVRGLSDALTAMKSKDPRRRAAGAVLLGSLGPTGRIGVRKLDEGLNDKSALVRRASAHALGNIGAPAVDGIPGLVALAMQDKELVLDALQAMTRIAIDAQLIAARKPPATRISQILDKTQSWLRLKAAADGGWGDPMTDAFALLALIDGGVADVNRPVVRRGLRRLVLRYSESKAPPPLVAALLFMAWREVRDPLYLVMGNQLLATISVTSTDSAVASNLQALVLKQALWAGEAVDVRVWHSVHPTTPVLLGRVLRPGKVSEAVLAQEQAEASRMVAKPLKWERNNERWNPRNLIREAWALNLAGGKPRKRFQDAFFQSVFPKMRPPEPGEPPTVAHWEPPGGNNATALATTAAITAVLRMYSDQYPPRHLYFPKAAKLRIVVSALKGALKHPDPEVQAYARSMLTLWTTAPKKKKTGKDAKKKSGS